MKVEIYKRHFRVSTGDFYNAVCDAQALKNNSIKEIGKVLKEIGAESRYYGPSDGGLSAIVFKEKPDSKLYKKVQNGWYPKKNLKAGKVLAKQFEDVKIVSNDALLNTIGLGGWGRLLHNGVAYRTGLVIIPSDPLEVYVSIPWYDADPSAIEDYKKRYGKEGCTSSNIETILWEPPVEFIEIKEWERSKAIDEWNESVRDEEK